MVFTLRFRLYILHQKMDVSKSMLRMELRKRLECFASCAIRYPMVDAMKVAQSFFVRKIQPELVSAQMGKPKPLVGQAHRPNLQGDIRRMKYSEDRSSAEATIGPSAFPLFSDEI